MLIRIVIVDDAQEDLFLEERVFRQCKILNPISLLKSGEECIDYFRNHRAEPVLLLLDMTMDLVSGVEVLRRLRAEDLARQSTIVMLSGLTELRAVNEGYQLGARTFLAKPLRTEDVLELINLSLATKIEVETAPEGHRLFWKDRPLVPLRPMSPSF